MEVALHGNSGGDFAIVVVGTCAFRLQIPRDTSKQYKKL